MSWPANVAVSTSKPRSRASSSARPTDCELGVGEDRCRHERVVRRPASAEHVGDGYLGLVGRDRGQLNPRCDVTGGPDARRRCPHPFVDDDPHPRRLDTDAVERESLHVRASPDATSSTSASTIRSAAPSRGVRVAAIPRAPSRAATRVTNVSVTISIPSASSAAWSAAAASPSARPAILLAASTMVTRLPKRPNTCASSSPTAPAPRTSSDAGSSVSSSAPMWSIHGTPSMPSTGGTAVREPVETRIRSADSSCSPTLTVFASSKLAAPSTAVNPRSTKRCRQPPGFRRASPYAPSAPRARSRSRRSGSRDRRPPRGGRGTTPRRSRAVSSACRRRWRSSLPTARPRPPRRALHGQRVRVWLPRDQRHRRRRRSGRSRSRPSSCEIRVERLTVGVVHQAPPAARPVDLAAAVISPMWLNACGKLPSSSPLAVSISSASRPRSFA